MQKLNIFPLDIKPPKRRTFARDIMLAEFGQFGHWSDGQWADHVDLDPKTLAEKRIRATWGKR